MKIHILISGLLFCLCSSFAQTLPQTDRVKQVKIKFFSEKLDLSAKEAKQFWPIYHNYQSRKNRLANERKNIMHFYSENSSNMSEQEISKTLNRYIEIEKEETLLLERFNTKFKTVLPDDKVLKIYIAEVLFRKYLLKQLRTESRSINLRN